MPTLQVLADLPQYDVSVVTFPDRPVGRKQVLTPSPVKACALQNNLPVYEISNKKEVTQLFETHDFDLGLVIAFGVIFPESILDKPTHGVTNVHFSLLPQLRGASPVQTAILQGLDVSGITLQRMVGALDAGDIQHQAEYKITGQTTSELFDFFAKETAALMPEFLQALQDGTIESIPQDADQATFCGKFEKTDGCINPKTDTAQTILRKYRAFDMWPGIYMMTDYGRVKIQILSEDQTPDSAPMVCADGKTLHVQQAQREGKKTLTGKILAQNYAGVLGA